MHTVKILAQRKFWFSNVHKSPKTVAPTKFFF